MWATIVCKEKGLYKLDNIHFYGPLVAFDDIIFAEYNKTEQMLTYRRKGHFFNRLRLSADEYKIREQQQAGCVSGKLKKDPIITKHKKSHSQ